MTFHLHEEVAAVEHADGKPVEHGHVPYVTVTGTGVFSVTVRFEDGDEQWFWLDTEGRPWDVSGRWRLCPVCSFCDMPILGTPVEDDHDPLHRKWCTGECRDASAEGWAGQHYGAAVAT